MYALIDLIENKCLSTAQTKLDLLIAWCRHVERVNRYHLYQGHTISFLQLNITGKDTYSALLPDGGYVVSPLNGIAYPTHSRTNILRRYQVLDQNDHPVDIRTWTREIDMINSGNLPKPKYTDRNQPVFRRDPVDEGSKDHSHRINLPKMMIQQCRHYADACADAREWRDMGLTDAIIQRLIPRQKTHPVDATIRCEYKHGNKYRQHSWKNQTKSCRQFARHKKRMTRKQHTCRTMEALNQTWLDEARVVDDMYRQIYLDLEAYQEYEI